ncbi:MAG: glycerophosphodiester phosphodiesterase [Deltaproteobacteria bacterium]|nr:glycerophosphodiester phosphodiesterase [Deltaproteobacteria bacterium]
MLPILLACAAQRPGVEPPVAASPAWSLAARHPGSPWVVAHRGASAYAPENTLAAYREALARGAIAVETDVHVAATGEVVVSHDATTLRTTGVDRVIADTPWRELRALDAGRWFGEAFAGEPLPLLSELLALLKGRAVLCLELKAGKDLVALAAADVDRAGQRGEVVIFSFDAAFIAEARALLPDVPAVHLLVPLAPDLPDGTHAPYAPGDIEPARASGATAVGFAYKYLSAEVVAAAHEAGFPVFAWTVNDEADALRVRDLGADVIISNRPDAVQAALSRP